MSKTIDYPIPGASQPKEPVRLIDESNVMEAVFGAVELDDSQYLAIQHEIEKLPTMHPESMRPTAHWISVKDRLPVAKEVVLTYESAFDSMSMAFRLPDTEEFINVGDYYALDAVTHWMPLPEPPEVTP